MAAVAAKSGPLPWVSVERMTGLTTRMYVMTT